VLLPSFFLPSPVHFNQSSAISEPLLMLHSTS
jgi:hypothetical protein